MVAVFLGYFLADETLSGRILIASVIIVGSVILINYARMMSTRSQPLQTVPDGSEGSPPFEKGSPFVEGVDK
jgi:hypothetical protein